MELKMARLATLIGDTTRSRMLLALMSGKALTATELSLVAEVTAQTASSHLNKLVAGELLLVRKQGRHKYFQLRDVDVAVLLENLLVFSAAGQPIEVATGPDEAELREARLCYDHLAGEVAVKLYRSLLNNNFLQEHDAKPILTADGEHFFSELGFKIEESRGSRRPLCRSCLDWSERKNHLAGRLGSWILTDLLQHHWAEPALTSRAVMFTQRGKVNFFTRYRIWD